MAYTDSASGNRPHFARLWETNITFYLIEQPNDPRELYMEIEKQLSVADTRHILRTRSRSILWIGAALIAVTGAMYAFSIDHAQREMGVSTDITYEGLNR